MADTDELLLTLSRCGWHVVRRRVRQNLLPHELELRYPQLPVDLTKFLGDLELCINVNGTVWFLTRENYHETRNGRFRWNEQERMCLEAADGDEFERERIREYWDHHFPFLFAVHSDYDYLAVDLSPAGYGQIVHGYMPEPEQSSPVARHFAEFVDTFVEALQRKPEYPFSCFI